MPAPATRHPFAVLLILMTTLAVLTAWSGPAVARDLVPTPPGGGPGLSVLPGDNALPFTTPADPDWLARRQAHGETLLQETGAPDSAARAGDLGGDDVLASSLEGTTYTDLAIAENGTIYGSIQYYHPSYGEEVRIFRSQDDGNSFALWGRIYDPDPQVHFREPSILVAEGNQNRCFVACERDIYGIDDTIVLYHSDLSGASASWSPEVTVLSSTGTGFSSPCLASDTESYSAYYLYLVAEGDDGVGQDIWYTRSTDYGASFESGYEIATLAYSDRAYEQPRVCWGYGGIVHASWHFSYADQSAGDDSARYRRCQNNGGGGLASWDYWQTMTPSSNGMNEHMTQLIASHESPDVMLAYARWEWSEEYGYYIARGSASRFSDDTGQTWDPEHQEPYGLTYTRELLYQPNNDQFVLCGSAYSIPMLMRVPASDPTSWTGRLELGDRLYQASGAYGRGWARNPAQNERVGCFWPESGSSVDPDRAWFDGEWRRDPGYPNYADGFPLDLTYQPMSPPALVDIDGDGDLEIVFTDAGHNIQIRHHDGSSLPGWPVHVAAGLSEGPAAVGDLNGDGRPSIVVGSLDGQIFAFGPDGQLQAGFPSPFPVDVPVHVSIGALGGPYPRTIVAVGGERLEYRNYRGVTPLGTHGWIMFGNDITHPAAIGDLDGDGVAEVIAAGSDRVVVFDLYSIDVVWTRTMTSPVSDAVTLGDIDLDGDQEVAVPLADGTMHLLNDDGTDCPNFPRASSTTTPLTSAAWAQIIGSFEPDLIVASRDWTVDIMQYTGSISVGYPQHTETGWWLHGAPVAGDINTFPAEVLIGSRDMHIYAWTNIGVTPPGWPKAVPDRIQLSPAVGDIDQDGDTEIVYLSLSQLLIVDVQGEVQQAHYIWPMYGHDPQRTGCHNCPEDVLTPVEDPRPDDPVVTRVSFAAPAPNPTSGPTLFSYQVPVRAQVRLDVYDIRGHRVRTVLKEQKTAGSHAVSWDGRDGKGRPLPSGVYFARLQVRGPGVNRQLSRKVNLLR